MKQQTIATLNQLEKADWFRSIGQQDAKNAIILTSWEEAIVSCSSENWQELLLEAANRYTEQISVRSGERFKEWNNVASTVKNVAIALVNRKTAQIIKDYSLPNIFQDTVQWDIFHLLMEAEYADIFPPGFFASQGYWYIKGHFPCGWRGGFPNGILVIF